MSNVFHILNMNIRGLFLFFLLISFYCGMMYYIFTNDIAGARIKHYLPHLDKDQVTNAFKTVLIYCITISHLIPMSLYVAIETLKLTLAFWVKFDAAMICHQGLTALARSSDLIEELGQVGFVFSDKTG